MKAEASRDRLLGPIIFVAAILRFFRLDVLTEFLGDQGRTMLIMKDFAEHGVVPLAGPTTLTGHHLGPFFYYLLLPGYLFSHGPIGVSVWLAFLGVVTVYFVYKTGRLMFPVWVAQAIALLWAVSPSVISGDRVIWEPNLVPLFSVLFIYLLYMAHVRPTRSLWVYLGMATGILVQLHVPDVIFIALTGIALLGMSVLEHKPIRETIGYFVFWLFGFCIVLVPFMCYEYTVQFRDLTGIASVIGNTGGMHLGKRELLFAFFDYGQRVFGRALPFVSMPLTVGVICAWAVYVCIRPSKFNAFLSVWLFGGLGAMARFNGVVFDHYLYFLTPVPFLMLGSVFSGFRTTGARNLLIVGIICIACVRIIQGDLFRMKNPDIWRVSAMSKQILLDSASQPFSFTLINSPSFSDLHYRYYFRSMGVRPESIYSDGYTRLFIICDGSSCPDAGKLLSEASVPVLCYEEQCKESYTGIRLDRWRFENDQVIRGEKGSAAHIYRFIRR